MNFWPALLGAVFGGVIAMILLSWLISAIAYKSFEPDKRAVATVMTAYIIGLVLYGFSTGGLTEPLISYTPGAIIAFLERRRHYRKHWRDESEIENIFG